MNKYIVRVEYKAYGATAEIEALNERQASAEARQMLAYTACCNKDKVKVKSIKLVEAF